MSMEAMESARLDRLLASLLEAAPQMNFMQFCRLLDACHPDMPGLGADDSLTHEPVRFLPVPCTGFPAGEISAVETDAEHPDWPPTVRATFMGLYGVDAVMPSSLIDDIVLREEGHEAVEAFLDQFNHRFVTLLYRVWKKYRYPENFRAGGTDAHSRSLLCLAGFGWADKPGRAGLPDVRLLALTGLVVQKTRTPEGLASVAALALPGADVRVDEFWPVMIPAGCPQSLTSKPVLPGDGMARGLDSAYVLGKRMICRNRAVRLTVRPCSAQQANDLLPDGWLHHDLLAFVQLYVGVKADVYLRMELSTRLVPPVVVGTMTGSPSARLGWTTVLPANSERQINIALGRYEAFSGIGPNPYLHAGHA